MSQTAATGDYDYDLFTIGAGSGGVRASRLAAQTGARVAIAEEYRVGGTCVIRGCVPKKLFVYASEFAEAFHAAKGYGWEAGQPSFDWKVLKAHKDHEIDRLNAIYGVNLDKAGVKVINSRATLKDAHTVYLEAEDRTVTAKHILIATGAWPTKDERIPGVEYTVTSNELFEMESLPGRILIAGGGYIAVEFAGIFNGLGVETTLVYRGDKVLRGFDEDVRDHLMAEMQARGIRIITETIFEKVEKTDRGLLTTLKNGEAVATDMVLFAIGRKPYTEGLGLEEAGVEMTKNGAVVVDEFSKSSVDHIYAVGDVTDRVALTPVAIREGAAFVETVFKDNPTSPDHETIPTAVFSQPEIGTVGLTEAQAIEQYGQVDVYRSNFRPMFNILADNPSRMLMKMIVEPKSDRVVGVHVVGPHAGEMIQFIGVAVKMGATKAQFDATMAVHPTAAEELVTMKEKYYRPTREEGMVGTPHSLG